MSSARADFKTVEKDDCFCLPNAVISCCAIVLAMNIVHQPSNVTSDITAHNHDYYVIRDYYYFLEESSTNKKQAKI